MNDTTSDCNQPGAFARKTQRAHYAVLGAVCALVIGVYAWNARSGFLELWASSAENHYYNQLVRGFQAGQLNLKREVPAALTLQADLYDAVVSSADGASPRDFLDLSYYKGKLYFYFGVSPALMLFWPYAALTGHYLLHKDAVVIFFSLGFLASAGLLWSAWRRYFPTVGVGTVAACTLAVGLTSFTLACLPRAGVYEVAISCGYALAMMTLTLLWQSMHAARGRIWWLAGASLAYGLAVGARPSLLFGAAILLVPVVRALCEMAEPSQRRRAWILLLAATTPITVIGLGLMLYNFMRFDNPFEFGHHYALSGKGQHIVQTQYSLQPFSLRFLWCNLRVYFLEPARWSSRFPFVGDIQPPALPPGHAGVEHVFGILPNLPLVWLVPAVLLFWRGRLGEPRSVLRWFVVTLVLLFGMCALTLCLFFAACNRYQVDFLPALVLLAVLGILGLERALAGRPAWRRAIRWGSVLLLAFSVSFNVFVMIERASDFYVYRGFICAHKDQLDEAVVQYRKALARQPDNAEAHSGLGFALSRQGKGPEAIAHLEEAVRLKPDSAEMHSGLGTVLFPLGRAGEAISHYEQALRLKPDYAEAHDNLALALVQRGQMAEAIRHFEEALRLEPEFARAHNNLGVVLVELGKAAEAIGHYEQALRFRPDYADAHMSLGIALSQQGKLAEAIGHYEQALRIKPDYAEAHDSLAGALVQQGQMAEAIRHYEAALRLKPEVAETHNNLGVVLFRQGKKAEAIVHLKEAVRLKPDYVQAQNNLRGALRQ